MISRTIIAASIFGAAFAAAPAAAQQSEAKWYVRAGVTRLDLRDKLDLTFAGAPVPGAGLNTKPHYTPTVQVGRFLGDYFALELTVGLPPHIKIDGRGALQPYGRLAETTYGPTMLTAQFRPIRTGPVQPYIGGGAAYMIVFSTKDAAFKNVEIDNDLSPALIGGTDVMFNDRFGLFVDAKKAFLRTEARGTFGGAPVVGKVKLDPFALSAGVTARF